ncbi:phosphotransferase enzyme family protein [Paenibacillus mendelii]|uniref:Phosphotransferase enzyme family protein n=1 Tax=Paenibacillus mendelii TaxID=206163 RepID=A0ABV6JFC1_9BACL|nr:phosphotransferase [Paenibacillus mendelii]MCQ6557371.1 phosphotransferase [Paenibacillus mendelii]
MLKLKYLFNNTDLAEMLLSNWEYDPKSLDLFQYYRISSNAVYPFQFESKTELLRFAPASEKESEHLLAELDFIGYLRANRYNALEPVISKKGTELVEAKTPWGAYYATVFKRVSGIPMNDTDFSDSIVRRHGQALGKLHQLSSRYESGKYKRWAYTDALQWVQNTLATFPLEAAALAEVRLLQDYFSSIPVTSDNYGLIHYDFEYDNVFYDEENDSCHVIDFDDAMYHWYVMDIVQALDSLQDCIPAEQYEHKKRHFMDGYLTEYEISDDMQSIMPACKRFAALYGYARLVRSSAEQWENEPEWLQQLRERWAAGLQKDALAFGTKLSFIPDPS